MYSHASGQKDPTETPRDAIAPPQPEAYAESAAGGMGGDLPVQPSERRLSNGLAILLRRPPPAQARSASTRPHGDSSNRLLDGGA